MVNSYFISSSPRKWQKNALPKWKENFSGVVSVVTGGGKTFFALYAIVEFLKKNPSGKIVIVVPTVALQDQWYSELNINLKVAPSDIKCFPDRSSKTSIFNIIIVNTARKICSTHFRNEKVFLIVDECHRCGSKENSKALNIDTTATLGLSATPRRQYDDGFEKYVVPKLGNIIYEYDYKLAAKDGVISKFDMINIRTNFTEKELIEYNKYSKQIAILLSKESYNQQELEMLMLRRSRVSKNSLNRLPVALKILLSDIKSKTIVFTQEIKQAESILNALKKRGLSSANYHTKISKVKRRSNLIEFKKGVSRSLITCTSLDEGLNVPDIERAIIVSQSMSNRQRIQRLGRALRKGKELAKIYTIYITDEEKSKLMNEFVSFNEISNITWKKVKARV